jgi:hypothetical protein
MITTQDLQKMMARAAKTNLERDVMERASGLSAVSDTPQMAIVRTALCALEAGLRMQDWSCVAEATDMLAKMTGYYPWLSTMGRPKQ